MYKKSAIQVPLVLNFSIGADGHSVLTCVCVCVCVGVCVCAHVSVCVCVHWGGTPRCAVIQRPGEL